MKIIMVWGQRKVRYPGEYTPELIEAISEYEDENNRFAISNAFANASKNTDFVSVQIIEANINDDMLNEILSMNEITLDNIQAI